jgi:hypothetical protein
MLCHPSSLQLLRTPPNSTALERTRLYHRTYWDYNNPQGVTYASPGIPFLPGDSFLVRWEGGRKGGTEGGREGWGGVRPEKPFSG